GATGGPVRGGGGVGPSVVEGAGLAGAAETVAADPLPPRLELARRLGATRVVRPDDLAATMKEALPDGADYVFDAVGDPETTTVAFRSTRNGGVCVIVGLPSAGARLELDPVDF